MALPFNQSATSPIPAPINQGSNLRDLLFGQQNATQQFPRFTGQQQGILNQLAPYALEQLMGNQANFAPLRQQAEERFQTQTIPSIAERFTSFGGQGTRNSSAFNAAAAGAGSALQRQLAGDEQLFNMQRQNQLQSLLGLGLTPSFENVYLPGSTGLSQNLLGNPDLLRSLLTLLNSGQNQQQLGGAKNSWWDRIKSVLGGAAQGAAAGGIAGGVPGALVGATGNALSNLFSSPSAATNLTPQSRQVNQYLQQQPNAPLNTGIANIRKMAQERGLI